MRVRFVLLISLLALGLASLLLRASPGMPWQSVDERWASAVMQERFEAAGVLMSGEDSGDWAERARQLRHEHGEIQGLHSDAVGLPAIGDNAVYRKRLTWEDGFASCVLTREKTDGSLGLVSQYEGCEEHPTQEPPGFPSSATFVAGEPPPELGGEPPSPPDAPVPLPLRD
jgi:hypothetical protein